VPSRLIEFCTTFFNVKSATVERFGFQNINVNSIALYHRIFKGMKIRKGRQHIQIVFR